MGWNYGFRNNMMIPNYSFMPVDLTTILCNSSHTAVSRSCYCVSKMNFRKMDSISSTVSKIHSQRRHFIIDWCLYLLLPAPHRQWVMHLTNQEACWGYWTGRAIMLGVKQVLPCCTACPNPRLRMLASWVSDKQRNTLPIRHGELS